MINEKQDIAYFLSFCIEQYKVAKSLTGNEAMTLLSGYSVLEYLEEHYEALHTQSRQWLVEEIDDFIKERDKDCEVLSIANNFEVAGQSLSKLEVTQHNLHLLLPSKVSRMAVMLVEDEDVSMVDAMIRLYSSRVYARLEDESTKAWNLGPVALYEEFQEEA